MVDNPLEQVIDQVAGAMTSGEPGVAFRAGVMQRIDRRRNRRRSTWWLAPVAAAAALTIAVFLIRHFNVTAPEQRSAATLPSRTVVSIASVPTEMSSADAYVDLPQRTAASRRTAESSVRALAPDPLTVPPLSVAEIEPGDSIEVPQLETIAPITLTPIGEPQGERR